ncbi:hypothetical protein cyc_03302 [Cyclospora cayetanensis]|uniref:Uncharacterized protein n=1 Tax=Cyclospora cayetanensis TaxID=88456 RepID=A0A1D3D163_9EIME|nr:hypothetical protein cyc_03302 [Cyclospora cayetanensis]
MLTSCLAKAAQTFRDVLAILLLGVRYDIKEIIEQETPDKRDLPEEAHEISLGPLIVEGPYDCSRGLPPFSSPPLHGRIPILVNGGNARGRIPCAPPQGKVRRTEQRRQAKGPPCQAKKTAARKRRVWEAAAKRQLLSRPDCATKSRVTQFQVANPEQESAWSQYEPGPKAPWNQLRFRRKRASSAALQMAAPVEGAAFEELPWGGGPPLGGALSGGGLVCWRPPDGAFVRTPVQPFGLAWRGAAALLIYTAPPPAALKEVLAAVRTAPGGSLAEEAFAEAAAHLEPPRGGENAAESARRGAPPVSSGLPLGSMEASEKGPTETPTADRTFDSVAFAWGLVLACAWNWRRLVCLAAASLVLLKAVPSLLSLAAPATASCAAAEAVAASAGTPQELALLTLATGATEKASLLSAVASQAVLWKSQKGQRLWTGALALQFVLLASYLA